MSFFKQNKITLLLVVLIIIFSMISIFIGAMDLTPILRGDFTNFDQIFITRLPRLLAIICTGIGMSVAGLIMQKLCMNNFVSPTTGATLASAQFGVLLAMMFFPSVTILEESILAFSMSVIGTWIFVWFIQRIKFKDVVMVPLIGMMFSTVIGGITNYFAYRYDLLQALQSTFVGDFSLISRGNYEIVYLVIPLVIVSFIYANHFNVVGMGENFSKNLGVNYNLVLFLGLSICAMITASIVVTVGSVSYIGLIIPNIVAMFRGDKIRGSIVDVALFGALYVLICDIIGRVIIAPFELPIDLISGVIGSIIFLVLMFKKLSPKVKRRETYANSEVSCAKQ